MIVELHGRRYEAVLRAASGHQALLDELTAEVETMRDRKGRVRVDAAYVAWSQARDLLAAYAFTQRGRRDVDVPKSVSDALADVTRALLAVDRHPAMFAKAMIGHQQGRFQVWQAHPNDERGRTWTPMPRPGYLFAVLEPSWISGHGRARFTQWETGLGLISSRLDDEKVHLRLMPQPAARP